MSACTNFRLGKPENAIGQLMTQTADKSQLAYVMRLGVRGLKFGVCAGLRIYQPTPLHKRTGEHKRTLPIHAN